MYKTRFCIQHKRVLQTSFQSPYCIFCFHGKWTTTNYSFANKTQIPCWHSSVHPSFSHAPQYSQTQPYRLVPWWERNGMRPPQSTAKKPKSPGRSRLPWAEVPLWYRPATPRQRSGPLPFESHSYQKRHVTNVRSTLTTHTYIQQLAGWPQFKEMWVHPLA